MRIGGTGLSVDQGRPRLYITFVGENVDSAGLESFLE